MNTSGIVVLIHKGSNELRESLLLAPEVAARLGWSNGKVISERQAQEAQFLNAMHGLSQGINAVYEATERPEDENESSNVS